MAYARFDRYPDAFINGDAWFYIMEMRKEADGSVELLLEDYDPFGRDFWINAEDAIEIRRNYEEPLTPKTSSQITKYLRSE